MIKMRRRDNLKKVNKISYLMGRDEFIYLCTLTGAKEIYCMEDMKIPYAPAGDKDIARWDTTRNSLCNKKYIKINENRELVIDNLILYMISSCCNPKIILTLSFLSNSGKKETKVLYINSKAAIEVETDKNNCSGIVITPHNSANSIYQSICESYPEDEGFFTAELFDKSPGGINNISRLIILKSGEQSHQIVLPGSNEPEKAETVKVNIKDIREKLWDMVFTAMKGFTVCEEDGLIE